MKIGSVEVVILDEADRMLDLGFAPQLTEILDAVRLAKEGEGETDSDTPKKIGQIQHLLFSATWSKAVQTSALTCVRMNNPVLLEIKGGSAKNSSGADDGQIVNNDITHDVRVTASEMDKVRRASLLLPYTFCLECIFVFLTSSCVCFISLALYYY